MLSWALLAAAALGGDWPQFRGPEGRSVAAGASHSVPLSADHLAWKAALPGQGASGVIVVGQTVIATAAAGSRQDRLVTVALDAATGRTLWKRTAWATGPTVCASFGGVAASTPASDGTLVFALFSSNDLLCFDLDGHLKWIRGLSMEQPLARNDVGMASSPLVAADTVIVQLGSPGESFAAGLDAATGQTRWTRPLEVDPCWTTPVLWKGRTPADDAVVLQTQSLLSGVDPVTGRELWTHSAPCSTISSATPVDDILYVPADGVTALRRSAGPGLETLWQEAKLRMANVSPVVHEGRVYVVKSPGILVAGDAQTGEIAWQLRLKGPIWATPVIVAGHLYAVSHEGLVQIVRLGDNEGQLVGSIPIDGDVLASPAIADGAIYFRSRESVWKFSR